MTLTVKRQCLQCNGILEATEKDGIMHHYWMFKCGACNKIYYGCSKCDKLMETMGRYYLDRKLRCNDCAPALI